MTRENKSSVGSQEVGLKVDISVVLDSAGERFDSHFLRIETALPYAAVQREHQLYVGTIHGRIQLVEIKL